tara:strand:+ start:9 stop:692 length:684 start_codon:yes stop_codon:yes gene_type:complete
LKIAIHQPNFFPYSGFFHKLINVDTLVLLDDVQFEFDLTNRNKIISKNNDWIRISIPTNESNKFYPINKVEVNNEINWKEKNWKLILDSYCDSPFFYIYEEYLKNLFSKDWKFLFDINYDTLMKTLNWLDLKINIVLSSTLNIAGSGTERLVNICKILDSNEYVSGIGGKRYLDENLFNSNNIKLSFQNYSPIAYTQHNSKQFIKNLSILDLLMNMGPKSLEQIKKY